VRRAGAACGAALLICVAAPATFADPDSNDIIQKLALPKPDAADLAAPTRGIRAVKPGRPAHAPEPAPSIDLAIPFNSGAATVAQEGAGIVAALGHALASPELAADHFKIEGHADTVGAASANLALSQRRAENVVAALTQRYGIAADRLSAVGVGSDRLVVPTPDQTAEPRNRVVRVINLGAGQ
jgi:outer membrane protein OmpA-like peptidoglycan-associated protein